MASRGVQAQLSGSSVFRHHPHHLVWLPFTKYISSGAFLCRPQAIWVFPSYCFSPDSFVSLQPIVHSLPPQGLFFFFLSRRDSCRCWVGTQLFIFLFLFRWFFWFFFYFVWLVWVLVISLAFNSWAIFLAHIYLPFEVTARWKSPHSRTQTPIILTQSWVALTLVGLWLFPEHWMCKCTVALWE